MYTKKPKIVIVGAGMAGITAAHKLHKSSKFDIHVVEGGNRIGGRIKSSVFCNDNIELGATWIHGIENSPVYEIAKKCNFLEANRSWECMSGVNEAPVTVLENGYELDLEIVERVSKFFEILMSFSQGKEKGNFYENCVKNEAFEKRNENLVNSGDLGKKVYEKCVKNGVFEKVDETCVQNGVFEKVNENGMNSVDLSKRVGEKCVKIGVFGKGNCGDLGEEVYENCVKNGVFEKVNENGANCGHLGEKVYENCVKNGVFKKVNENGVNCGDLVDKFYENRVKNGGFEKVNENDVDSSELAKRVYSGFCEKVSIGEFLRKGFELFSGFDKEEVKEFGDWDKKSILEAVFEMKENTQRTYTSADDLETLDLAAESEYKMFQGDEITIAKGYMSVVEYLASVLPYGCVQLGKKVSKIEWRSEDCGDFNELGDEIRAVKVNFSDGSYMFADHVIVTVSLGVLKAGVCEKSSLFDPPLPRLKVDAIRRLGYGVVNKLFMELSPNGLENGSENKFPFLQMAFHKPDSEFRDPKVPCWMRRTNSFSPIYENSNVVLSWFAGKEALELESLEDEEIIEGVSNTLSCFTKKSKLKLCTKFDKVLKTQWGKDPLFLGSYSYVAVGSSGDDLNTMAMPLPENPKNEKSCRFPLQILFAGEATHRTHYSTTHGAYFSGIRESNRLLQHYDL